MLIVCPIAVAFFLWLGLQVYLVIQQSSNQTHISALSHFGGVLVGLLAWLIWLRNRSGEPE